MIHVTCYTAFGGVSDVATMVVTVAGTDTPAGRVPVTRLSKGRFIARADLQAGADIVAVTAHTRDGTRLRGEFQLQIPG
jgi:hypothetical protein